MPVPKLDALEAAGHCHAALQILTHDFGLPGFHRSNEASAPSVAVLPVALLVIIVLRIASSDARALSGKRTRMGVRV